MAACLHRYLVLVTCLVIGGMLMALTSQAQTLHAILVADTSDTMLYAVCKRDIEVMHRQFVQLAAAIKYQLHEQIISGKEFSSKRLDYVVRNVAPQPNDILFVLHWTRLQCQSASGSVSGFTAGKEERISQQNPGLAAIHHILKSKNARLCITMGDCCNHLVNNMRGMVKKTIVQKATNLPGDSVNATYRKLFLNVTGDALIASSQPRNSRAHPDSGSFYTRSFNEALELACLYNTNITWETLLHDTQTRLTRHQATHTKQSIYEVNVTRVPSTDQVPTTTDALKSTAFSSPQAIHSSLSFDQINRQLNQLTDKSLSSQQRLAVMNQLTVFFAKQARIEIYVNSTLGEVQPVAMFLRRLVVNAGHIQQINLIERLSEVTADGRQFKRAAIQEVW